MAEIAQDLKDKATPVLEAGFEAGTEHDDIKGELFSAGIPFGKINTVFKSLAIELGLMKDPAVLKAELIAAVEESDWEGAANFAQIEASADEIAEDTGATPAQVMVKVRAYCKENDIELPKKAASKGVSRAKGGKCPVAIVDLFNEVQKPTKVEFYEVVRPLVKAHKNAMDYMTMFMPLAYAIGNSMTLPDALAEMKDMDVPEDPDAPEVAEEAAE